MVVLEGGGMLSSTVNQYLQPDYLSPLPTTLDAKKSPLALLAQTCSQIGADSPTSKPLLSSVDKSKKSSTESSTRQSPKTEKPPSVPRSTPEKPVFKPYENTTTSTPKKEEQTRPSSKNTHSSTPNEEKPPTPCKSSSPEKPSSPEQRKSSTPRGASPIIRSGLEILHGHKDTPLGTFKPLSGFNPLNPLCCPPGLEHTNPAFRPPFGAFSHHHMMYPGASPTPYLSYARVKTPSGGEALVPVCKDPYCTGCQFSMQNQQPLACPSGCTQCDHQKYNLAMAMMVPPGPVPSSLYPQLGRPYICNWIAGESYCGKRFVTSEELLQHLRTHSASDAAAAASQGSSALFSSLHRYPNPPLSPLSGRYHPYAKPGVPGASLASPFSAFNPAIGPYYSPYSIYGQRLGAAAVHP